MLYLPQPLASATAADLSEGASHEYVFHDPVAHPCRAGRLFSPPLRGRRRARGGDDAASLLREQLLLELLHGLRDDGARSRRTPATVAIAHARTMIDDAPATAWRLADLAGRYPGSPLAARCASSPERPG
ncbi:hypothetical protein [Massilia phosphatilytica]